MPPSARSPRISWTTITWLAVMGLALGTAFIMGAAESHNPFQHHGGSLSAALPEGEKHVKEFEHARRLLAAREYSPASEKGQRRQGAAWVFVVAADLDTETQVHFVRWYPPPADVPPAPIHKIVTLDGWAMPCLALLDIDGSGNRKVIVRVSGVSYSRIAIIDFARTQGTEIVLDDMEAPASWRSDFADLDKDGRYEMIRWVNGRKLVEDRRDGWKWRSLRNYRSVYMIYHLRHGQYRLARATARYPVAGRPVVSLSE